jgi:enoyl-CoA hydratase
MVHYEERESVAVVTIDRPEARNAVDGPTAAALADAFRRFEAAAELRAAVLTGAGGTFCAGADLKQVSTTRHNIVKVDGDGPMGPTRMQLGKPVIAAVEGYAVAGGLELALWCDVRIVASNAIFGVFCRRWGVPLVDGGTVRLPRIVGHGVAMDMILTGRPVAADEALRIGLANRVTAPGETLAAAIRYAENISAFPQFCLRADRRSAIEQWNLSVADALAGETRGGIDVISSGETAAGAQRFADGAGRHGRFEHGSR